MLGVCKAEEGDDGSGEVGGWRGRFEIQAWGEVPHWLEMKKFNTI